MIKPGNPHLVTSVKCAGPGCSNVRRESNHWFLIAASSAGGFRCRPYVPRQGLKPSDQPVCGQACAQKLFERFLARAPAIAP